MIEKIDDITSNALDRLPTQFKGKERIEGMIAAFTDQLQEIEDVLSDLVEFRALDNAQGAQIDVIGKIVGEPRKGRNDDLYKLWVRARIAINTSRGTPEDLIKVFNIVTGSTRSHLHEYRPAEVEIFGNVDFSALVDSGPESFAFAGGSDGLGFGSVYDSGAGGIIASLGDNYISEFYTILDSVLAGGVRLNFIGWYDADEPFAFAGNAFGEGFGTVSDSTVGGKFATVIPPP